MTDNRNMTATPPWAIYVLGAYGVAMLVLVAYMGNVIYNLDKDAPDKAQYWPLLLFGAFNLAAAVLGILFVLLPQQPAAGTSPVTPPWKLLVLGVAGLLGLSLSVMGVIYAFQWWDASVGGLVSGRAAWKGGPTWQHWRPYIVIGQELIGLGIMFASLLVVRSEERTNPILRRLLYGYSTFLTAFLLLDTLIFINVLAFFYVGLDPADWTETNIYTLSQETKKTLKALENKVDIYVILQPGDPLFTDVRTLLENMKAVNKDKMELYFVNPNNDLAVAALMDKYEIAEREGVLVVWDPEGKPTHQFLKTMPDLEGVSSRGMMSRETEREFKGEQAILSALRALQAGKVKTVLYFTQDSGELSLEDFSAQKFDVGLGRLSSMLQESKVYEPKPLLLAAEKKVPEDAFGVVIAGPQEAFTADKIEVLKDYMKRDGRLVVLLDVTRERQPAPTGLEDFLREYGVQVGQDLILNGIDPRQPTSCMVSLAPGADEAFQDFSGLLFRLINARSVKPVSGATGNFIVTPFLEAIRVREEVGRPTPYQWAEDNPKAILDNPEEFQKKSRQKTDPPTIAVTVRDRQAKSGDVHAQGDPRIVVFGDATFVSNAVLSDRRSGPIYYRLFSNSLSWLRKRDYEIAPVEPKTRKSYRVTITPEQKGTLQLIPGLILLMSIVAIGAGVWIMRRR